MIKMSNVRVKISFSKYIQVNFYEALMHFLLKSIKGAVQSAKRQNPPQCPGLDLMRIDGASTKRV